MRPINTGSKTVTWVMLYLCVWLCHLSSMVLLASTITNSQGRKDTEIWICYHMQNGFIGFFFQVPMFDSTQQNAILWRKIKQRYRGVDYSFDLITLPLLPKFSTSCSELIITLKVPHRNYEKQGQWRMIINDTHIDVLVFSSSTVIALHTSNKGTLGSWVKLLTDLVMNELFLHLLCD